MATVEQPSMYTLLLPVKGACHPVIVTPSNVRGLEVKKHLLQQHPRFYGVENEDVMDFIREIEHFIYGLEKPEGVKDDNLRLRIFPMCLFGKARTWMNGLEEGSITTWDKAFQTFVGKYYPVSMTKSFIAQISEFKQRQGESFFEAWERFRDLQRQCPHHRFGTSV